MTAPKRSQRNTKTKPQLRGRTTRRSGKALADPATNTAQLDEQLRALGLYAAPTIGDGNCLFRALSDQLYGTDHYHGHLRREICDWIEYHKQRYEPFVEDDRGLSTHLKCMRQNATYGGHMELSAFAHYSKKNVKVVQPGLVYVIEWDAGWDSQPSSPTDGTGPRRSTRDKHAPPPSTPASTVDTVYVAYHDWEHFSSIRNLRGPHSGIPAVKESPGRAEDSEPDPAPDPVKSPGKKKKPTVAKTASTSATVPPPKLPKIKLKLPRPAPKPEEPDPVQIPLPQSRSTSPTLSSSIPPSNNPSLVHLTMPHSHRSPKRSFDETSSCSSESSTVPKRTRKNEDILPASEHKHQLMEVDDVDLSTPSLSSPSPSSAYSSPTPELTPSPEPEAEPEPVPVKLTRRQRKALGLPKKGNGSVKVQSPPPPPDWAQNGSGRMDVRGFRELKI